jgi:hypothetical protein
MAMIPLSIDPSYCSDWGYFNGVRELLQNAKDGEEYDGYKMDVAHFPRTEKLIITNKNVSIEPSTLLLLGKSSKKDGTQRGKFGEGFVLGVLALVRDGFKVTIHNGNEVWRPEIAKPDEGHHFEGSDLLVFSTRKLQSTCEDFSVTIEKVSTQVWEETRKLFLFLVPPKAAEIAKIDGDTVLFNEEYTGKIFSRGIFVCNVEDLECGYDLSNLTLDRDRNVVDQWDLRWALGDLWKRAVAAEPAMNAPRVYRMAKENKAEVKSLVHHADDKLVQALREEFEKEHGQDVVAVSSMADSRELESLGAKTVMVTPTLQGLLDKTGGEVAKARNKLKSTIKDQFAWGMLSTEEQKVCTDWVDRVTPSYTIVSFSDDSVQCRATDDGRLTIAKWLLSVPHRDMIRAIVTHEAQRRKVPVEEVWLDALGLAVKDPMVSTPSADTVSVDNVEWRV